MATESMIAEACRTDEEIARRRMSPCVLADPRGIVGGFDEELDPAMQEAGGTLAAPPYPAGLAAAPGRARAGRRRPANTLAG